MGYSPGNIRTSEAAKLLRVSTSYLRHLARNGKIPCEKDSRGWLFKKEVLLRRLAGRRPYPSDQDTALDNLRYAPNRTDYLLRTFGDRPPEKTSSRHLTGSFCGRAEKVPPPGKSITRCGEFDLGARTRPATPGGQCWITSSRTTWGRTNLQKRKPNAGLQACPDRIRGVHPPLRCLGICNSPHAVQLAGHQAETGQQKLDATCCSTAGFSSVSGNIPGAGSVLGSHNLQDFHGQQMQPVVHPAFRRQCIHGHPQLPSRILYVALTARS